MLVMVPFLCFTLIFVAFPRDLAANFVPSSNARLARDMLAIFSSRNNDKNVAFSPSSLLTGIGILYEGMGDESKNIIGPSLGFPSGNLAKFEQDFANITSFDRPAKRGVSLVVVATQAGVKLRYGTRIKSIFQAQPFHWDFSSNTKVARKNVNLKVAKTTKGGIRQFLEEGSISSDTSVLLVNVLHFQSNWSRKFDSETVSKEFKVGPTVTVPAEMMFLESENVGSESISGSGYIVALPFQDEAFSMVLILPPLESDIGSFVLDSLDSSMLDKIMDPDSLPKSLIALEIPKFNIRAKTKLKETLSKIPGLDHMFSSQVDLSKMAERNLRVDQIHHMAVVDVNQNGVEASAATGISVTLYSAFQAEKFVTFDRPFLYFIVEKPTKIILFSGYVKDPSGE